MTRLANALAAASALAVLATAAPVSAQGKLEAAYKREYAFLEAEKRALKKRIADDKVSAAKRIAAAKAEIAALQGSVVAIANQAETINELMLAAERDIEGLDESGDTLGDIVVRADTAYDKLGIELPAADAEKRAEVLAQLRFAFERAPAALATQASVRRTAGTYFDATGRQVSGDILHIGNVAAFGLADGARGVLSPAGGGKLKLWPADGTAAAAGALASGQAPTVLPFFLFESLDKSVEQKKGKSLREFIDTGGIIGWVIVGLGLLALAMIAVRFLILAWATWTSKRDLHVVLGHLDRGDTDRAAKAATSSRSPTGKVLAATLNNLEKERGVLEDIVAETILGQQPLLSRFGASILVIAAVSPLLGLLGTVTGMISTFDIITEFGTGNPKLLSGGISEALVTTELGLIVAIPSLLLGHILSGFAERARDNLDGAALSAVNRANGIRADQEVVDTSGEPAMEPA